ncbi:MAG TPA: hypothetical protein VK957_05080 [Lunatimonas sp.]|nr:hypothetical protein [Lunatimonas sp.]
MHIVFQFPIVDCRPLLPDNEGRLNKPEWPNPPASKKSFVRRFGAVRERRSGGSVDWPAEENFCSLNKAMHYEDLHKNGYPISPDIKSTIYNSYRRYFSDGYFLGKIEAGFVDNLEKKLEQLDSKFSPIDIEEILRHFSSLPVLIDSENVGIIKAGKKLAKKYHESSTSKSKLISKQQHFVEAGEIVILLIYAESKNLSVPKYASLIEELVLPNEFGLLKLYGYKLKIGGYPIKVWLISTPVPYHHLGNEGKSILRNLRINLLRVHLEKETLRILLNAIKSKKIHLDDGSQEAYLVDSYFKKTAEKLFQKERYVLQQKNLLEFALQSEQSVSSGSFNSLEEGIHYFQDQFTRANIQRLLSGMSKKTILFICTSPKNKNPLDFGSEFKGIKDSLQKGTDRYNYVIEIEPSVKKNEFLHLLLRYQPDFLHLSMHSSLDNGLYFEDENKQVSPMPVEEFDGIMKVYGEKHNPQVVILSACNSNAHAQAAKKYCKYAVGTQTVFPMDAGVIYAAHFYACLFENNFSNIQICHDAGKNAIEIYQPRFDDINNIPVHEIPVLF